MLRRIIIKKKSAFAPSDRTLELLSARLEEGEGGTFDVADSSKAKQVAGLTEDEMQALRDKHESAAPNFERALEVKKMILNKHTCRDIVLALRHNPGMGERQVKADHAALAPLLR